MYPTLAEPYIPILFAYLHEPDCSPHVTSEAGTKIEPAMVEAFLQWGGKSNDQISFACNPYLASPHVTCPTYLCGLQIRPTLLASIISASQSNFLNHDIKNFPLQEKVLKMTRTAAQERVT